VVSRARVRRILFMWTSEEFVAGATEVRTGKELNAEYAE
jgi:hypothetical protein